MSTGLVELYDSLSVLYNSLPDETHPEWKLALKSALFGDALLDTTATCYGKQQNERNYGKRKDRVRTHGNGTRITDFSAITVRNPRPQDEQYLPTGAQLPVAPKSDTVLPVLVTDETIDWALTLLAEFPPEPAADRPGEGATTLLDRDRIRVARERVGGAPETTDTTLLFVSDTHLGYENRAITNRGKTIPWIDEISTTGAFTKLRQLAIQRDVDAVVHTGDILDHEVDQDTLDSAEAELIELALHDIPFYCILGSHDQESRYPQHSASVDGIAWLRRQRTNGTITELTISPTQLGKSPVGAYGIAAGNIGLADVDSYASVEWTISDITFGPPSQGSNVLCLHDRSTPYRTTNPDVDLDELLARAPVSFDCVLIGDEHRPKNEDFDDGYTFATSDGTPVYYTGPAARISWAYRDRAAFVSEITISDHSIARTCHPL